MKSALVKVGPRAFRAEVADGIIAKARGLSGHAPLAPDEGMLFIFPVPWRHSFWMKGMEFPIDIIWIRKGVVAEISENVPAPRSGESIFKLPKFKPRVPVDMVLEVNAGVARELGIKAGDKVEVVAPG